MDVQEILEKLPPAPAGVERWIRRDLIKNTYIIYSKKEDRAICTRCGHTFRAGRFDMAHNYPAECPKCKSKATYKASGIGRKNLVEYLRVLLFTHRGNTVYATLTEIEVDFSPFGKPDLKKWVSAVYMFNEKEQIYYKHRLGWCWSGPGWERRKKIALPYPPSPLCWNAVPRFGRTKMYETNLTTVFTNSCLKYFYDRDFFDRQKIGPYEMIKYIHYSLKYQSVELLLKAGFEGLVVARINDEPGTSCVHWRGKNLQKILRLPKRHIRKLQENDPEIWELETFQKITEKEKFLPWEIIETVANINQYDYRRISIEKHVPLIKWAQWAVPQGVNAHDWIDYIGDCEKLGLDTRKKSVLFPENFHETHWRFANEVEIKENPEKNRKIQCAAKTFAFDAESDIFTLKMPESQIALNKESSALNHCVKNYGDRIANGETLIYFIRKKDNPNKPFYTLEIHPDGEFIQCRGKNNCTMTPEVEAFKNEVVKAFKRMLKKKERSAA